MQEWLAGVIAGVITAIVISIAAIRSYYSLNKRGINKVYRIHLSSGEFFDVVLIANGILISPKLIPGLLNMSIVDKQTGEVFGEQKLPLSDKVMETVIEGEINYDEVYQYELKEQWYFDKQHSIMKIRTLAICPIRRYMDPETGTFMNYRRK